MKSDIKAVLTTLQQHGYEAYVIGGFVRDKVLGIDSDDVDIATNATPTQVKELFDRTVDIGMIHGSIKVMIDHQTVDITTYRSDGTYHNHRHPEYVEFGDSLEKDVLRRDFTMNALAMNSDEEIIDLVEGQRDIERRMIKAIGDPYQRVQEDALRIIRALRFVSVLGFDIEDHLLQAMKEHQGLVELIAIERIQVEVQKLCQGAYLDKMNHYLSRLDIASLPPQFVNDSTLSLVEQLAIAVHKFSSFRSRFKLTKQEQKQFMFLQGITSEVPKAYDLYSAAYPESMIKVGAILYGWDSQRLFQQLHQLVIRRRDELQVRGHDIQSLGLSGADIESILVQIEQAVIEETIPNKKDEILTYAKERMA